MAAVIRCGLLMANSSLASSMTAAPATPEAFPSLRFGRGDVLFHDAREGLHEAVDVGVGGGERAAAESALGQEHPLVDETEEGAEAARRRWGGSSGDRSAS